MEPENRPYVDSATKPGDDGTEEWSDTVPGPGDPAHRGPLAGPLAKTDDEGAVEGSPADEFINDPDVIGARNETGDKG